MLMRNPFILSSTAGAVDTNRYITLYSHAAPGACLASFDTIALTTTTDCKIGNIFLQFLIIQMSNRYQIKHISAKCILPSETG